MNHLAAVGTALVAVAIGAQSTESSEGSTPQVLPAPVPEAPAEPLASFWWGDCDGDGLLDAFAVAPDGTGLLLRNRGDGSFEDATLTAGLAGIETPTAAAWEDFDCDGDLDLFVGTAFGPARLMRNLGAGSFEIAHVGIDHIGWDQRAAWIDYDSDGYPDLQVRTKERDLLYHNLGQGLLEPVDLGLPEIAAFLGDLPADPAVESTEAETGPPARPAQPAAGAPPSVSGGRIPVAPGSSAAATRGPGLGGSTPPRPHPLEHGRRADPSRVATSARGPRRIGHGHPRHVPDELSHGHHLPCQRNHRGNRSARDQDRLCRSGQHHRQP